MSNWESESELIPQAVAGDRASLSQLFLMHYDDLSNFLAVRISSDVQALVRPEDILQQTFIRAARSITSFQPEHAGSFAAWLRTIAQNLLRDLQRRRQREGRGTDGTLVAKQAGDASAGREIVSQLAGDQTSPSRRAGLRESLRRMEVALMHLPDDHREVIRCRYLQGESLEQIARKMGSSKEAVRGICYRARKRLRANLGRSSQYFSG